MSEGYFTYNEGKFRYIENGFSKLITKKHRSNPNLRALKTIFYGGMQGLVTRKMIDAGNINNKELNVFGKNYS